MADQVDREIELTIEAVTGTVYDLCVSPFETILGIKTKIQRLEGIPVYQQHLVYDGLELQDDYCLDDYCIRSGCQLKLVLAMRGGPIHANRIQVEDSALLELVDYLDVQSGDEEETQFTVMLLGDGNIGLIKAGDSPIELSNERLSRGCTPVLGSQTRLENKLMRERVTNIQTRLRDLRIARTEGEKVRPRKWKEVVILSKPATARSKLPSSASHTPTQPQSWNKRGSHTRGDGVQRQLQFTPAAELPPICHHRTLDKPPPLRHRRCDLISEDKPLSRTDSGSAESRHPPNPASSCTSYSRHGAIRNSRDPYLPDLVPHRKSLCHGSPSPPILSPITSVQQKRRNRCMQCGRRMRLAATFTCRCGGQYCATHRYAEMHPCTFNYKEHGREIIARKNPLITAPKLPKI